MRLLSSLALAVLIVVTIMIFTVTAMVTIARAQDVSDEPAPAGEYAITWTMTDETGPDQRYAYVGKRFENMPLCAAYLSTEDWMWRWTMLRIRIRAAFGEATVNSIKDLACFAAGTGV